MFERKKNPGYKDLKRLSRQILRVLCWPVWTGLCLDKNVCGFEFSLFTFLLLIKQTGQDKGTDLKIARQPSPTLFLTPQVL
jgi:hypothetical protein